MQYVWDEVRHNAISMWCGTTQCYIYGVRYDTMLHLWSEVRHNATSTG